MWMEVNEDAVCESGEHDYRCPECCWVGDWDDLTRECDSYDCPECGFEIIEESEEQRGM